MGDQPRSTEMTSPTQPDLDKDLGFAERAAGPCVFVLFGAAGDLTKRKLVPALFNLGKARLLPENFAVIGVSVDDLSLEDFRSQVTSFLPAGTESADALEWFRKRLFYERGDFADPNTFTKLRERLAALDAEQHTDGNYLFYLATAPKFSRRSCSNWAQLRSRGRRMGAGVGWLSKSRLDRIWSRLRR
jgi:glucose-6-phosphate 1-dehydrogenase